MLEKFEGSVAALREIERQYGQLQVLPLLTLGKDKCTSCRNLMPVLAGNLSVSDSVVIRLARNCHGTSRKEQCKKASS